MLAANQTRLDAGMRLSCVRTIRVENEIDYRVSPMEFLTSILLIILFILVAPIAFVITGFIFIFNGAFILGLLLIGIGWWTWK